MTLYRPQGPALLALAIVALSGCTSRAELPVEAGYGANPELPAAQTEKIPTVNIAPAVGWPEGAAPIATDGTAVTAFASGLDHPRWLYVLPNGDVLVAESNKPAAERKGLMGWVMEKVMKRAGAGVPSANRITLLRDSNGDGIADQQHPFLEQLNSPFGMALVGDRLYVANTDAVVSFPYTDGTTRIDEPATQVTELPAGELNHHWTKNLIANPLGDRLYITVGSNSNVAENGIDKEEGRAAIWELDLQSGEKRLFATGLRNPNGLAWQPETGALWTAVNERDLLGGDLVPDYMTQVVDGGFYGWPYSYYGQNIDERVERPRPDLVERALKPDYALGSHTASLGLAWSDSKTLPAHLRHGMFIGQHGSWNRTPLSGYKVIFVPFHNGMPADRPIDVLTGFLNEAGEAQGRPAGVAIDNHGALLVADDVGNVVWRVTGLDEVD